MTNWLPSYWKEFQRTTRYTYVVDEVGDPDKVSSGFLESVCTYVRKAEKKPTIREYRRRRPSDRCDVLARGRRPGVALQRPTSVLVWHAVKAAGAQMLTSDPGGFMREPVERLTRTFTARRTRYFGCRGRGGAWPC